MTPRLGRGLASLIPDTALDLQDGPKADRAGMRTVPLDEIRPNPEQPREVFAAAELEALADSIRTHGVLSPLVVRRHEGRYILIAGERRLRAAGLAGLKEVPVIIRDAPSPREQLELALVENLQRADLDAIEAARGYDRLARDFRMTQDEIALRVGRDRATIANALRLLKLPEYVQGAVRDGRLSAGHARALVPLAESAEELRELVARVIAQQLSVRATERLVAEATATPKAVRLAAKERRERTFEYATRILSEAMHAAVEIKSRRDGGGQIVIGYSNAEDLERLISQLRQTAG